MRAEDKQQFDHLNQSAYLFRLSLERLGFEIQPTSISGDTVWHVFYEETIVGTVTFRTAEDGFTYCNIRLYSYLKQKLKRPEDFIMSDYYEIEDGIRTKFRFDKFEKYFNKIKAVLVSGEPDDDVRPVVQNPLDDSISRLLEYCDEYDQKFSKNIFISDIMNIIRENESLNERLKKKSESIMNAFLRT